MRWPFSSGSSKRRACDSDTCDADNEEEEILQLENLIRIQSRRLALLKRRHGLANDGDSSVAVNAVPYYLSEFSRFNRRNGTSSVTSAELVQLKVRDYGLSTRPSYRTMKMIHLQLVASIDNRHVLALHSLSGEELVSLPLEHGLNSSPPSLLGVDGEDVNFPTIVTAGADGSVHVISLEIASSGMIIAGIATKGRSAQPAIVGNVASQSAKTSALPLLTVKANITSRFKLPETHACAIQVRSSRPVSSTRERLLHIVDNAGTLHRYNTTGSHKASLPLLPVAPDLQKAGIDVMMAGNGQILAVTAAAAPGKTRTAEEAEISVVAIGPALKRLGSCYTGVPGRIRGLAWGVGSIQTKFLYALLEEESSVSVLKFETRFRANMAGKGATGDFCQLLTVTPDPGLGFSRSGTSSRNRLFSDNGYVMGAENCGVRVYNASKTPLALAGNKTFISGKGCSVDASFPPAVFSGPGSGRGGGGGGGGGGLMAILTGGLQQKGSRSAPHSYGHASSAKFILVSQMQADPTLFVVYSSHVPPPQHGADSASGFGWITALLQGPFLLAVVGIFVIMRWRNGLKSSTSKRGRSADPFGALRARGVRAREEESMSTGGGGGGDHRRGLGLGQSPARMPTYLERRTGSGADNYEDAGPSSPSISELYNESRRLQSAEEDLAS